MAFTFEAEYRERVEGKCKIEVTKEGFELGFKMKESITNAVNDGQAVSIEESGKNERIVRLNDSGIIIAKITITAVEDEEYHLE